MNALITPRKDTGTSRRWFQHPRTWLVGLPVAFIVWYLAPSYYSDGNVRFTMHHGGKPGTLTFIVRDAQGQPCPDIPVMSRSSSGTTGEVITDLSGTAVIEPGESDVLGVFIDEREFHFRPRSVEYELFPPDCSGGLTFKVTLREFSNPTASELPRFADELPGYRFLRNAPWRHLFSPTTNTEDVLGFMSRPDEDYTDHPSAAKGGAGLGPRFHHLRYEDPIRNWTVECIMTVGDPPGNKTDRLSRVKYIPRQHIDFRTVKLPSTFQTESRMFAIECIIYSTPRSPEYWTKGDPSMGDTPKGTLLYIEYPIQ